MCLPVLVVQLLLLSLPQGGDYSRASALYSTDPRPVEALMREAAERPNDPWAWHFLGRAQSDSRHLALAMRSFRRAAELDPEQSWHHWQRGVLLSRRLDQARARDAYEIAHQLQPDSEQQALLAAQIEEAGETVARSHDSLRRNYLTLIIGVICLGGLGWHFTRWRP